MDEKQRIEQLRRELHEHNYRYYVLSQPTIGDREFDMLMKELQEKLGLPKLPYQIECFDNSNISGTDAVAACVVFKSMKPSKKDYKRYNIKTVDKFFLIS